MSLIQRLVFGTARLAGGAYAAESRALLEDCLAGGIRHFDTAPAYGMGAAEALIGEVTAGDPRISVHTKAGLVRPSNPALRGWGKRLKSLGGRDRSGPWKPELVEYGGPAPSGRYDKSSLEASVARSCRFLRRDKLDLLLLHAAEPGDIDAEAWQVFEAARATGTAAAIGFAHPGPPRSMPDGLTIQIAPRGSAFHEPTTTPWIFHSVRTAEALAQADPLAAAALENERSALPQVADPETARLVGGLACLARAHPNALLVIGTTSRARLKAVLDLAANVEIAPPERSA